MNLESKHNLKAYWRGCRCLVCKLEYRGYANARAIARAKGQSNLVEVTRAKQLLLTFESTWDAARVTKVRQSTIFRIISGRTKKIQRTTEARILKAA